MDCLHTAPPSEALVSYDRFVKWVLLSPLSALGDVSAWPQDLDAIEITDEVEFQRQTRAQEKLELAITEAIHEELVDDLFELERECEAVLDTAANLELDHHDYQAKIKQLEHALLHRLKERDEAIADQFALEQRITEISSTKPIKRTPKLHRGMTAGFIWPLSPAGRTFSPHDTVKKEIQMHEKLLAHEKLSLAEAKSDLDQERFATRSITKAIANVEAELQASRAIEDQLKAQLNAAVAAQREPKIRNSRFLEMLRHQTSFDGAFRVQVHEALLPHAQYEEGVQCRCYVMANNATVVDGMTEPTMCEGFSARWHGADGVFHLKLYRSSPRTLLHVEIVCGGAILATTGIVLDKCAMEIKPLVGEYLLSPEGRIVLSVALVFASDLTQEDIANNEDTSRNKINCDEAGEPSPEKCYQRHEDTNNDNEKEWSFSIYQREPIHNQPIPLPAIEPTLEQVEETRNLFRFGIAAQTPPPFEAPDFHDFTRTIRVMEMLPLQKDVILYDEDKEKSLMEERSRLLPNQANQMANDAKRRQRMLSMHTRPDTHRKPMLQTTPPPIIVRDMPASKKSSQRLEVGKAVHVGGKSGSDDLLDADARYLIGIIRYIGATRFAPGIWIGIELEKPVGKNGGTVDGIVYFSCRPNHGVFIRANRVDRNV